MEMVTGTDLQFGNQVRIASIGPDPAALATADIPLTVLIDSTTTPGVTYIGSAPPGTNQSSAAWQVKQISSTGSVTWGSATGAFINVWANRASLSYA
jgi:hypothetical protein